MSALYVRYSGNTGGGGSGNVVGPGSSVAYTVPVFADTTGKLLADTPVVIDAQGDVSKVQSLTISDGTNTGSSSYLISGIVDPSSNLFAQITQPGNVFSEGWSFFGEYSSGEPLSFYAAIGAFSPYDPGSSDVAYNGFADAAVSIAFAGMACGPNQAGTVNPGDILMVGTFEGPGLTRFNVGGGVDLLAGNQLGLFGSSSGSIHLAAPATIATPYTITFPESPPSSNTVLSYNGTAYVWGSGGGSGITGPGSSVSGDIVSWNSTTGAVVADSGCGILTSGTSSSAFLAIGANAGSIQSPGSTSIAIGHFGSNQTADYLGSVILDTFLYDNAITNYSYCTLIGRNSAANIASGGQTGNTFVGANIGNNGAGISGNYNVILGAQAAYSIGAGSGNTIVGADADASADSWTGGSYNLLLGSGATSTAVNSMTNTAVIGGYDGSGNGYLTDIFIGHGMRVATANLGSVTVHSTDTTLTSNASASASVLNLAGGRGTGTGVGGAVNLQTAPAGSSGSTQNSLVTGLSLASTGAITLGPASKTPQHALNTATATTASGVLTLTNAPSGVSGNPAGYIEITVNGSTHYIPYW